jgi:hypothetical protein
MTTIIESWEEFEKLPYEIQLSLHKMAVLAIVAGGITEEITPRSDSDHSFGMAANQFMEDYMKSDVINYKIGPGLYEKYMAHCAIEILKQHRI